MLVMQLSIKEISANSMSAVSAAPAKQEKPSFTGSIQGKRCAENASPNQSKPK